VKVQEINPPYVGTRLGGGNPDDPNAMKVDDFVDELLPILGSDANEVIVKAAQQYREHTGPAEYKFVVAFNQVIKRVGPTNEPITL
jgi:short-subunit dehydrogenase involved in D-alanine esterification of teichoic acids